VTLPETSDGVDFEVRIAARPEVVFQFFTDPVKMMLWKGVDAALDPRPGGTYRVNVTGRDTVRGEYVEIVPYSRIVFTWGWEEGPVLPGSSLVEFHHPGRDGDIVRCRPWTTERQWGSRQNWNHYLRLFIAAASRTRARPGRDRAGSPRLAVNSCARVNQL
jgi:uncharacterized protein YndB with AHSA1/START domain